MHVDVECEQPGRTTACPAFLLGVIDANPVFLHAPRAKADVVLHVSAVDYALIDPRGNRLSVSYTATYEMDHLNLVDTLGETRPRYASHGTSATGSVRKDTTDYGLSLGIGSEMVHPERRNSISVAPSIAWQLGGHVDLTASWSFQRRTVVGPDPSAIDTQDYAEISQLSYAQPLSFSGSLGVTVHWDRTNGARNDR